MSANCFGGIMAAKKKIVKEQKKVVRSDEYKEKNEREGAKKPTDAVNERPVSAAALAMPYVLMVFSLILAICFVTVQLIDRDGAGVIGYAIQWFFCGLLGSAAFLLPLALFYIGLRKCIYNFRWASGKRQATAEHNRSTDRRRITVLTVTALLFVVLLSVIFGVANDYASFGVDMWTDAAESPDQS